MTCVRIPLVSMFPGIVALRLFPELKVFAKETPFHWTVEPGTKPDPTIEIVTSVDPARIEDGEIEAMLGTGFESDVELAGDDVESPPAQPDVIEIVAKSKISATDIRAGIGAFLRLVTVIKHQDIWYDRLGHWNRRFRCTNSYPTASAQVRSCAE
jgi:hypothetical protein